MKCPLERAHVQPVGKAGEGRPSAVARLMTVGGLWLVLVLAMSTLFETHAQATQQNPSPMADTTRPHTRIERADPPGRRIELSALKGAVLFAGERVKAERPVPLIIHFHGAPWLVQQHIAKHLPRAALITVQLGAGSGIYGRAFESPEVFKALLDEASRQLSLRRGWSTVTLTGFSAGYGAIRAILRQPENFSRVGNVLLLDGIHASYVPEGKPLADGGAINPADVEPFVEFAREAAAGRKSFAITHSEIFPGTFASTTECTDLLLATIGIKRRPDLRPGPMGMQQLSSADAGRFHLRGYAGNTAPDHVDHLHAMPAWFELLRIN